MPLKNPADYGLPGPHELAAKLKDARSAAANGDDRDGSEVKPAVAGSSDINEAPAASNAGANGGSHDVGDDDGSRERSGGAPTTSRTPAFGGVGESARGQAAGASLRQLDSEPRDMLQFAAPAALRERLRAASFELAYSFEHLHEVTLIIGGLAYRNFYDHRDTAVLSLARERLERYLGDPISDLPKDVKLGGYVPKSVKRGLDGTSLMLKRVMGSSATAQALMCSAIWAEVDAEDPTAVKRLAERLEPYAALLDPRAASRRAVAAGRA